MFSKESTLNNTRIKSFKRVCFIIFSGNVDQYANKVKVLLDKISEVIKNAETVHPSLLILILQKITMNPCGQCLFPRCPDKRRLSVFLITISER